MSLHNVTLSITITSLKTQNSDTQHYDALNADTQHTGTLKNDTQHIQNVAP